MDRVECEYCQPEGFDWWVVELSDGYLGKWALFQLEEAAENSEPVRVIADEEDSESVQRGHFVGTGERE